MTQKQIEQAAKEYADDTLGIGNSGHYLYAPLMEGFIAGSESRQEEIDRLVSNIERYKRDLSELFDRYERAQNIIRIMHNCMSDLFERQYDDMNERGSRIQRCFKELEKEEE